MKLLNTNVLRKYMQLLKLILALVFAALMHIDSFGQAMPKYAAMVGQRESGKIVRGEFLAQQGVGGMRLIRAITGSLFLLTAFQL